MFTITIHYLTFTIRKVNFIKLVLLGFTSYFKYLCFALTSIKFGSNILKAFIPTPALTRPSVTRPSVTRPSVTRPSVTRKVFLWHIDD